MGAYYIQVVQKIGNIGPFIAYSNDYAGTPISIFSVEKIEAQKD